MKNIDIIYTQFIEKFKIALLFISKNFGDRDILIRKNLGFIQNRNFEIKNSQVKGYIFHGYGCDIIFKNNSLDIEFEDDYVGFTSWSFYSFAYKINLEITEEDVNFFLNEKVYNQELRFVNRIFVINQL